MNERLWEFGQQLPVNNKFQAVLKLALLRKSVNNDVLHESEYNKMCRKCHIPWTTGYFSVAVIPKCKRSTKQIAKLESRNDLTKQQQSLVKHLKTRAGRVAKYTCQICSYNTRIPLDAKVKWPERTVPGPVSLTSEAKTPYIKLPEKKEKKRKRHGKSNAGLKIPAKTNDSTNNEPRAQGYSVQKNFKAADFKLIQELLASSVSSNANSKAYHHPKGIQPVRRLRLSRS